ncbi:pirin family protein [Rheinheimera sp.]|uniref:pirin family protein n=1 Tax=Rheinheimera sp. TaxID=1869214 RepID=UPI00307E103A
MTIRSIKQLIPAMQASDGAGVKIKRSLGQRQGVRLDPFLMLDAFGSAEASDYIAGFPAHPHRGFETVTYMLDGHMLHEDHLGNQGHLKSGGVQWMTAGRGIIHSEMPQQESGLMRGFQLWINLPAAEKMKPAAYVDIAPTDIPRFELAAGSWLKMIAGSIELNGKLMAGPIQGLSTEPLYLDVQLQGGQSLDIPVPAGHNVYLYPFEGDAFVAGHKVREHHGAVLEQGDRVAVSAEQPVRFILLAAKPINEPVVQYGPFVMNSVEEIEQAIRDYQAGVLTDNQQAQTIQILKAH